VRNRLPKTEHLCWKFTVESCALVSTQKANCVKFSRAIITRHTEVKISRLWKPWLEWSHILRAQVMSVFFEVYRLSKNWIRRTCLAKLFPLPKTRESVSECLPKRKWHLQPESNSNQLRQYRVRRQKFKHDMIFSLSNFCHKISRLD
jgi:hypothetical protein